MKASRGFTVSSMGQPPRRAAKYPDVLAGFIVALTQAIERTDDQRIGQLLSNVCRDHELFYVEDEDLTARLHRYLEPGR